MKTLDDIKVDIRAFESREWGQQLGRNGITNRINRSDCKTIESLASVEWEAIGIERDLTFVGLGFYHLQVFMLILLKLSALTHTHTHRYIIYIYIYIYTRLPSYPTNTKSGV